MQHEYFLLNPKNFGWATNAKGKLDMQRMAGSSALKAIPELTNTVEFFPAKSVNTHALESH